MGKFDDNPVNIEIDKIHETSDAYLLSDGDNEFWVPKNLCEYDEDIKWITMPEWMALEKGMI
ncbi:hypothetical protein LCGC14_1919110 [marine sediment metagenome]|uniref:Uncharacterized protein n=1 Tax=marine sediment metagenome TaxID=412755 RepID=A0A0F9I5B1_9ZZZZ